MEALFDIIAKAISFIVLQVQDALNADVKNRVFLKSGEIQSAVTENTQAQYSNLENALGDAALLQYQEKVDSETRQKIIVGNVVTVSVAIFLMILIVAAVYYLSKTSRK